MTGVTLRTARLVLRPWREADREPFAALNADPEVRRFFPSLQTRVESDASADFLASQFDRTSFVPWVVEVPGVTPFAGFVGPWEVNFDIPPRGRVEIGWRLARAHWGKGYATEAAKAALDFGFGPGAFDHPRVAEGHPLRRHLLYRLHRKDWLPAAESPYTVQA